MQRSRGTGPRATGTGQFPGRTAPFHRRARACPSPCCGLPNDRGGQAPALREPDGFFTERPPHRRARACPSPCLRSTERSRGTGPRATVTGGLLNRRTAPFTVGRGPVPRHAPVYQTFAGDRPPRYGKKHRPLRRARACPSPCCGLSNDRGGQAPALRYLDIFFTGPSYRGHRLHRDQEVSPTGSHRSFAGNRDREVSPTERSRGTGPRATVTRACPSPCLSQTLVLN